MATDDEKAKLDQWNEMFLDNPVRAAQALIQENNKALRAEYERAQKQNNFWDQFYGRNPHLKEEEPTVKKVMQREWDVLMGMAAEDAIAELAHHANLEIEKQSKRRAYQSEYTVFRGGPDGSSGMPAFADPEEHSLSGAIKARKERRRNAQYEYSSGPRRAVAE